MPSVQTTYSQYMPAHVLGQIDDMTPHEIVSRNVLTLAGIQFGVPVFKGTVDNSIVAAGGGNTAFDGFAVLNPVATPLFQAAVPGAPNFNIYPYGSEAAVMKRGTIAVLAFVAVTPTSIPAIDLATGNIVTSATGGSFPIPGASFERTAAAGTIVRLRIH